MRDKFKDLYDQQQPDNNTFNASEPHTIKQEDKGEYIDFEEVKN